MKKSFIIIIMLSISSISPSFIGKISFNNAIGLFANHIKKTSFVIGIAATLLSNKFIFKISKEKKAENEEGLKFKILLSTIVGMVFGGGILFLLSKYKKQISFEELPLVVNSVIILNSIYAFIITFLIGKFAIYSLICNNKKNKIYSNKDKKYFEGDFINNEEINIIFKDIIELNKKKKSEELSLSEKIMNDQNCYQNIFFGLIIGAIFGGYTFFCLSNNENNIAASNN